MDPLSILALIIATVIIIQAIVFFSTDEKDLLPAADWIFVKHHWFFLAINLVFTGVVAYYVFALVPVTHIASVVFLTVLIMGITFFSFPKLLRVCGKEVLSDKPALALNYIIWFAFALLTFYAVFS